MNSSGVILAELLAQVLEPGPHRLLNFETISGEIPVGTKAESRRCT